MGRGSQEENDGDEPGLRTRRALERKKMQEKPPASPRKAPDHGNNGNICPGQGQLTQQEQQFDTESRDEGNKGHRNLLSDSCPFTEAISVN